MSDLRLIRGEQKRARDKAYYLANREERLLAMRAHYAANADRYKAEGKARYAADPERSNAASKAWRDANIERERAKQRARYAANPQPSLAYNKKWRAENLERERANKNAWRADNPEQARLAGRRAASNRLARIKNVFVESIDHDAVFVRDGGVCQICDTFIGGEKWEIDHVIPISRGGPHSYANVQLAHMVCNRSKHNKVPA